MDRVEGDVGLTVASRAEGATEEPLPPTSPLGGARTKDGGRITEGLQTSQEARKGGMQERKVVCWQWSIRSWFPYFLHS